ncbi:flavin reductase [Streptomyces sp. 3MP-14]|uniref:Flavin reductase n=1 Tax=Streptomyces mimosae TaxID=2586635 RepID=A0A5N6ACL1_9ACTN|nr:MULTISPECIES: flavin reductase family protein [Streptomyces]KAB8165793.1 flavin reductase [Streptomyces mimosae]KAB8176182.1 flavin reductase [Streptomyces sp. 3MP-14]
MTAGEQLDARHLTGEAFKSVFRRHPAGVAVIAMSHEGRPVGFTATSVISVSAEPPLLAFSLAATSSSAPAIAAVDTLTVSLLADHQDDVSARFATRGVDRFAAGGWFTLPTGEPVIEGAHAWIRARVLERTPVGGSFLISLLALQAEVRPDASPLVFVDRTYHRLGPETAI